MPIYEYSCKNCGEEFSVTGSYSSLSGYIPVCPRCRSKDIHKKIFPAKIVFKGKGFYKTDNGGEK